MMDTVFIATFLLLVVWRCSHAEPTAPDDPVLWLLACAIVIWRYVYRRAAIWDRAHDE